MGAYIFEFSDDDQNEEEDEEEEEEEKVEEIPSQSNNFNLSQTQILIKPSNTNAMEII